MERCIPAPPKDNPLKRTLLNSPVAALITGEDLLVATPGDSLQKIVSVLRERKKACVLVYEKKKLVGILSLRTLLTEAACKFQDLSRVTAADIMTRNPATVTMQDPISFAVNKMSIGGFRRLPVLASDGTPVSIIAIRDVLAYLARGVASKPNAPKPAA